MSRLLPSLPDSSPEDRDPRVVGVDDDEADDLIAALGSETARNLLSALHDEPATTSELASELDTTLQNVQYHLGRLSDAELVDVVDTAYSEKGREMNVYAAADEPLVLFSGRSTDSSGLKTALKRLLGGYGILALVSLVAQQTLSTFGSTLGGADDAGSYPGDSGDDAAEEPAFAGDDAPVEAPEEDADVATDAEATPTPEEEPEAAPAPQDDGFGYLFENAVERVDTAIETALSALEPGMVLFLGAALVFTVVWAYRYRGELNGLR